MSEREQRLRQRWEQYDRALRGDESVPFDADRESAIAAYTDWVDARLAERRQCPDGAVCHHRCTSPCWRVSNCAPLSGVFPNDEWPEDP